LKLLLQILILLLVPLVVAAQVKKPWNDPGYDNKAVHFGFSLGVHTSDLGIQRSMKSDIPTNLVLIPDVSKQGIGGQIQIVSNYRLGDNLDLRFLPGISLGSKTISFYNPSDSSLVSSDDIEYAYLVFPLDLKYRSNRLNNYRPYILGGLEYRYDLGSAREASDTDNIRLTPGNLFYEIGVGIDSYLPFFKLSTELKVGIGIFETKIRAYGAGWENEAASISSMKPFIVGLSFHFE